MPAAYFDNFPYFGYSLKENAATGEMTWVTDIFRRTAPVTDLVKNKQLFHTYQIVEGETPEMIADRVYGSVKYHWVISLINNITDPLLDWPKDYSNLVSYIVNKYGSVASAAGSIHHYTMTITKVDSLGNTSEETFIIDETKYDSLVTPTPVVTTFANGVTVTTTATRSTVDNYTYEIDLNETKRNIILLKESFVPQMVSELERLLV